MTILRSRLGAIFRALKVTRHNDVVVDNFYCSRRELCLFSFHRPCQNTFLAQFNDESHTCHWQQRRVLRLQPTPVIVSSAASVTSKSNANSSKTKRSANKMSNYLSFCDYDVYGFDVDHTLAKYKIPNLFDLISSSLAQYLIENKGYPEELNLPFDVDKDFCTRGIILDTLTGNFLKLTEDGIIIRASHGTVMLTEDQLIEEYGEDRLWPHYEDIIDRVDNIGRDRYRVFENFFDMPLMVIAARLVDIQDKEASERSASYDFWKDIQDAANDCYAQHQFADEKGGFFPAWKKDIGHYLYPISEDVRQWLRTLRRDNKKVFLMTSSRVDFAEATMSFILGEDWQSYFDLTITNARKPGFFQKNRAFYALDGVVETEAVTELQEGATYSQGSITPLMTFLSQITRKKQPKVLFFGDSLRSDVAPSKKSDWETVLILEEIDSEQRLFDSGALSNQTKGPVNCPSELEKAYLTSHSWGSFFTDTHPLKPQGEVRYMNTLWGYVIRKYADLAVPQLEYITEFPLDHKFEVFDHEKTHIWGFYPNIPKALQTDNDTS